MTTRAPAINDLMLQGNTCFGCSATNEDGLHIKIYRDPSHDDRLVGEYRPRATQGGFPHIVHGGLQFTALDCMAGWIVFTRGREERLMPLTQSATVRYRRPVPMDQVLRLSSEVVGSTQAEAGSKASEVLQIRTEIRDEADALLTVADFEYVVVPEVTFRKMVGIDELPESYRRHFGDL